MSRTVTLYARGIELSETSVSQSGRVLLQYHLAPTALLRARGLPNPFSPSRAYERRLIFQDQGQRSFDEITSLRVFAN
jgi:hypothetical protein